MSTATPPAPARVPRAAPDAPARPAWATKRLGWLALAALAYLPPLLTSPGTVAADTKQYLYLDPERLLGRAPYMWDANIGLGTVTHQTIGYLFPMGPFYAAFERLGVPDWIAQRIWLGSLLFAAGIGMLCLFRHLGIVGPGAVVGSLAYMLSPYSLDYAARISVILLPWAALGFLLVLTDKALRDRGWAYPAVFALVVQLIGGVNATALVFAGIAPALWVIWAVGVGDVSVRRALVTVLKMGVLTLGASLWWIAGLAAQAGHGLNVLEFTETVEAVARTATPNEVLRGLGYWFFYGQDKLGPWIEAAENYTQNPARIVAGYAIPALALMCAGFVRWRERVFFVGLALVGLVIAVGAYPYEDPSPFGALFKAFAERSSAGLALRSTGRATPLVVLALAMLLGTGVNAATTWLAGRRRGYVVYAPAALVLALVVFNFPALWDGTLYGANLRRDEQIPDYWDEAISVLDRGDHETRVLEVPGADFASYRWGNTVDPITPGLTDRPYVARELIPWGSPPAADLLNAFDRRLQEGVADPAAIAPVARLMSVGDIVARNDIEHERYDLVRPRLLYRDLDRAIGVTGPQSFGPEAQDSASELPRIDEHALTSPPDEPARSSVEVYSVSDPRRIVHSAAATGPILLAGDGEGLLDTAATGLLDGDRIVLYSASYVDDPEGLDAQLDRAPIIVVTDTNRVRGRRWSTVRDNTGYTAQRGEAPYVEDPSDARLEVFDPDPTEATASVTNQGPDVAGVQATEYGNPISFTAEDRAALAMDGDPDTAWKTSAFDAAIGQKLRITLAEPITASELGLTQVLVGPRDRFITEVELRFDGEDPVRRPLGDASREDGGETLRFDERTFETLEIEITDLNVGTELLHGGRSAVGFAEVLLTDSQGAPIRVEESIEVPTMLVDAVARAGVDTPLVYVFTRERQLEVPPRSSPEQRIVRDFAVPDERRFAVSGTARLHSGADPELLRSLVFTDDEVVAATSEQLPGCLHCGPRSAIDGDPSTAWQTPFGGITDQWIELETRAPVTVEGLDLVVLADGRHSIPTRLRISVDGADQEVALPPIESPQTHGTVDENTPASVAVALPEPLTGRRIRVTVTEARSIETREYYSGAMISTPVAIAELGIDGLSVPAAPARVESACRSDLVTLDGQPFPVRVSGSTADALAGRTLDVTSCGADGARASATLSPHRLNRIETAAGEKTGIDIDRLVLGSDVGGVPLAIEGERIIGLADSGVAAPPIEVDRDGRVRYEIRAPGASEPFWVVLGQSRNDGWEASVAGPASLRGPFLVDGFANGWLVEPRADGPIAITLEWTPQRQVWIALALSIVAVAVAIVLAVVGLRRSRRSDRRRVAAIEIHLVERGRQLTGRETAVVAAVSVVAATFLVGLWAGALAGLVVIALARAPRVRPGVALVPPVLIALVGCYIAAAQIRNDHPPVFEWPTLFPRAPNVAWAAVVVVAALTLVDAVRARGPDLSRDASSTPHDTGGDTASP